MKTKAQIFIAVSMLLAATPASAYITCGKFTTDAEKGNWEMLANFGWVSGFLAGAQWAEGDSYIRDNLDTDAIQQWLINYCRQNPLDNLEDAAVSLIYELKERQ